MKEKKDHHLKGVELIVKVNAICHLISRYRISFSCGKLSNWKVHRIHHKNKSEHNFIAYIWEELITQVFG